MDKQAPSKENNLRIIIPKEEEVEIIQQPSADGNIFKPLELTTYTMIINNKLNTGGNLEEKDRQGRTWLHREARKGNIAFVDRLIANGVQLETKDSKGDNALHHALQNSYLDTDKLVHLETATLLVEKGASLDATNQIGCTPLHLVVQIENAIKVTKHFLSKGANVNARDGHGNTPLHLAAELGNTQAVQCLLEKGAQVNIKNNDQSRTPLHCAIFFNQLAVVKLLLEKNPDLNLRENSGLDAFGCAQIYAKTGENSEMIKIIYEAQFNQSNFSYNP